MQINRCKVGHKYNQEQNPHDFSKDRKKALVVGGGGNQVSLHHENSAEIRARRPIPYGVAELREPIKSALSN